MTRLVRVDAGTPSLATCDRCESSTAWSYPLFRLTADGIQVEPWSLIICRSCGFVGPARVT